ncbi:hypothetical protein LXL04_032672 [Taraxacum kok-saghyz]
MFYCVLLFMILSQNFFSDGKYFANDLVANVEADNWRASHHRYQILSSSAVEDLTEKNNKQQYRITKMNADSSISVTSMSKKRERPEKGKKLNARAYKKLFQIAGQKMKEASQGGDLITTSVTSTEVNETETLVMKSCSDSKQERHRVTLESEEVFFSNPESANEHPQMDGSECVTMLKTGPTCSAELAESQFEVSIEVQHHVNKLRDYWNRGQNSVFFDGQDRIIKVVQFVLSLLDNVKQPILIITASRSLSLWESEFSKWSNSTNVVTYKETKDVRTVIKSSEFYNENGTIKFQVLLSSPNIILEDSEMLDHIKWELIVIDECQRPRITRIFKKVKSLAVDMKLLTVTSEIVDVRQSYPNILSLLNSKYEDTHTDADVDTNTLKERLAPFIAFECNFSASEFEEYWVPVHLSRVQIENYCSLLNSNSEALSSCFRNSSSLHDLLTQTQKVSHLDVLNHGCETPALIPYHPYLVDPTLRENLKTDGGDDNLDAEICVSGKLQLLDKLLVEIKRCGLRVLVLFQSVVSSEKITIGDILEDLVDRRFGQDSYVRILPKILSKLKRKELVNIFNDIDTGAFICLLDYRDCQPSITLSSVDVAILFNSTWNPSNDVKDLHKLTLDSNRLQVLRLYSSLTIEEKSLILSKQGIHTDRINYNTCHRLLAWGASYLINKLSENPNSESETSFVDDLVHELSSLLLNENPNKSKKSTISIHAQQCDGVYSKNIILMGESESNESCLIGENLIENEPNVFWSNLFNQSDDTQTRRNPSSRLSRRVKMSFRNPYYWFGRYEVESENDIENVITSTFVKTKVRSKRKSRAQVKQRKPNVPSTCTNDVGDTPNNQPPQPETLAVTTTLTVTPLVCDQTSKTTLLGRELENIKKEQEKVTKLYQEKKSMLLSECEKEILEIRNKYDALIDDSELCLTNNMKVLEGYYDLVFANKLLAETLNEAHQQITDKVRIVEIPASELVQSEKRRTSISSSPSLRAPAPHLRSSPSLFPSINKRPTIPLLGSHYGTC